MFQKGKQERSAMLSWAWHWQEIWSGQAQWRLQMQGSSNDVQGRNSASSAGVESRLHSWPSLWGAGGGEGRRGQSRYCLPAGTGSQSSSLSPAWLPGDNLAPRWQCQLLVPSANQVEMELFRFFIILGFNSKNPGTRDPAEFAQNWNNIFSNQKTHLS